jgi:hypothetical protein
MKVLLSTDETRAIVADGVSRVKTDDEFDAVAEELKQPVAISTPVFGDLLLDRQIGWFSGSAIWNGEEICVTFATDETLTIDRSYQTAEALWANQVEWKRKVEDFAVQQLLPIKNEHWLEEGERPLTADQFKARMSLDSISFRDGGRFEFWHHDGDLFWGHSIQVSGSIGDGLTDADIPG